MVHCKPESAVTAVAGLQVAGPKNLEPFRVNVDSNHFEGFQSSEMLNNTNREACHGFQMIGPQEESSARKKGSEFI